MTITPEVSAKTLTQLVATEIRVQMARQEVRQSQLARTLGKTEQWLSVRLRGRQPIDLNDLALIAHGLGVPVHQLLPPPEVAAGAASATAMGRYLELPLRPAARTGRQSRNRPPGHPAHPHPTMARRTARLPRDGRETGPST